MYFLGICDDQEYGAVIFSLLRTVVIAIQVFIPIALIIMGGIDLGKAVTSSDQDKIKAGQKTFFSRLTVAVIVFFLVTITRFVIGILPDGVVDSEIETCLNIVFGSGES